MAQIFTCASYVAKTSRYIQKKTTKRLKKTCSTDRKCEISHNTLNTWGSEEICCKHFFLGQIYWEAVYNHNCSAELSITNEQED